MRNKVFGRIFCAVLTVALCMGLLVMLPATEADAAAAGTMMSNAVEANFGSSYYKSWSKDTDHLNHYVKFKVTQKGILTITADKPFDSEGEYGRLYFTVYDSNGDPVWGNNSYQSVDDAKDKYVVNVGLASGTYYLTLKPGFSVKSGLIETWYKLTFKANSYCEIEENGSGSSATAVELKKKYTGWYGSAGSDYEEGDYYRVSVVAGGTYRIVWYNFSVMDRTSTIVDFLMPDGTSKGIGHSFDDYINSDGYNYCDVNVKTSGSAYIHIYNFNGAQFEYGFTVSQVLCPSGHKYGSWTRVKDATCSAEGSEKRTCSVCGEAETRAISKKSHNFSAWSTVKESTCSVEGSQKRTCSVCNGTETRAISTKAHTASGNYTNFDWASHKYTCAVCFQEATDAHVWDDGTVVTPATCLTEGVRELSCIYCDAKTTSMIPFSSEHQYSNDCDEECNICYQTRYVEHEYGDWLTNSLYHWRECTVCGAATEWEYHIHGEDATEYSAKTCTECGYEIAPKLDEAADDGTDQGGSIVIGPLLICLVILLVIGGITAFLVIKKR